MTDLIFSHSSFAGPLVGAILACLAFVVQVPSKVYHAQHCFLAQRVVKLIYIQHC
jgi:hypothetical protein